jgi:4-amino-4-deoxy-L-arabinose transferase-like glycosyltransferase
MDYGLPHPSARPDEERIVGRAMQILATGDFHPGDYTYPSALKYLNTAALGIYVGAGRLAGRYDTLWDFLFEAAVTRRGLQYRVCRTVSVILGVATVLLAFILGRVAYEDRSVGLMAASLVATCHLHVRDSHFATVDVTMTFFTMLSLLFAIRVAKRYKPLDFILAGLCAGLATATKYNAGVVILGLCIACLPAMFGRIRGSHVPSRGRILGLLMVAGVVMAVTFAAATPYTLIHYSAVLKEITAIKRVLYHGTGTRALWIHLQSTFPEGFGWPFFLAAAAGSFRAVWLRRPPDLVLLAFLVPSFATAASVRWVLPRYLMPYVPVLAVFAAEFAVKLLCRSRRLPALLAGLILVTPGVWKSVQFDRVAAKKDTRVLAAQWIDAHAPPRSEILLCRGYGAPAINTDRRRPPAFAPREIRCTLKEVMGSKAGYLITHEHPRLHSYSGITDRMRRYLADNARALAVFNPFKPDRELEPYFYVGDAFYLPISHLDAMERGGPILTIWELRNESLARP